MASYQSNKQQLSRYLSKQWEAMGAAAEAEKAGLVPIPPITTPLEVVLPSSADKQTSYVKGQAFPPELIAAAIAAYKRHEKKVLIVIADTNYLPHCDAIANVIKPDLCRNFTPGEEMNDADHYAQCLANLAADHPGYAGVLQEAYEAGAVEFALDKVLRDYGGDWQELSDAVTHQTPREGYAMTIYSNSWGMDYGSEENYQNAKIASPGILKAFAHFENNQGGVAHLWSAGNAGQASDTIGKDVEGYPAREAYPISVGAITDTKARAAFTSPGASVMVALGGQRTLSLTKEGVPALWSGTSSSCPYAAGLAALLFLIDPEKYNTQDAIRRALTVSAYDIDQAPTLPGRDNWTGYGLPQIVNLIGVEDEPAPQPPAGGLPDPPYEGPPTYNVLLHDVTMKLPSGKTEKYESLVGQGVILPT